VKSGCCNSCDEVKEAYEARGWMVIDLKEIEQCVKEGAVVDNELVAGEGCLVKGKVDVPKVAGNLHISPGHSFDFHGEQFHDNSAFDGNSLNLSHRINRLSYGDVSTRNGSILRKSASCSNGSHRSHFRASQARRTL